MNSKKEKVNTSWHTYDKMQLKEIHVYIMWVWVGVCVCAIMPLHVEGLMPKFAWPAVKMSSQ